MFLKNAISKFKTILIIWLLVILYYFIATIYYGSGLPLPYCKLDMSILILLLTYDYTIGNI